VFDDETINGKVPLTDDCRRPNKNTDRIVQLYDGFSVYLLIVNGTSRRVLVFLTKSKNKPIEILRAFLMKFGLAKGVIRTDQGSELARSNAFWTTMMNEFTYTVEPTGADNNGTLAVKVVPSSTVWVYLQSFGLRRCYTPSTFTNV